MNASPTEVTLILDAIEDVRRDVRNLQTELRDEINGVNEGVTKMDRRINGRIRKLEQFRWQLVGGAAALSLAAGIILRVI